jgi:hypothetical protein
MRNYEQVSGKNVPRGWSHGRVCKLTTARLGKETASVMRMPPAWLGGDDVAKVIGDKSEGS